MRSKPVAVVFIAAALLSACGSKNDLGDGQGAGSAPIVPQTLAAPTDRVTGSWNMQGESDGSGGVPESRWQSAIQRMLNDEGVQVASLQEAGNAPPPSSRWSDRVFPNPGITEHLWNIGTESRPDIVNIYWADPGQQRNGLAILSRDTARDAVQLPVGGNFNSRPMMGVQFDNVWYFNAHALSNGPNRPNDAADIIETARQFMANRPGEDWMVLADFNHNPGRMPPNLQSHIVASDQPTHQGGAELDFAYTNVGNNTTVDAERRGLDSDHWFVRYAANPNCNAPMSVAAEQESDGHDCSTPVPGEIYRFYARHLDNAVLADKDSDDGATTLTVTAPTGDTTEGIRVRFSTTPGRYQLAFDGGWCISRYNQGTDNLTTAPCELNLTEAQWEFKDGQIFTPGLGATLQPSPNQHGGRIVTATSIYQWRHEPFQPPHWDDDPQDTGPNTGMPPKDEPRHEAPAAPEAGDGP
jgi:hypothetical protein